MLNVDVRKKTSMSSGKKGKKTKGVTISLGEFLGDQKAVIVNTKSWADESEEYDEDRFVSKRIVLPTAPRSSRGPDIDPDKVPSEPPFIAYIANLPFDVDVLDIERFFNGLKLKEVRLPRDGGEGGRFKGFGYVEFNSQQDLLEALVKDDEMIRTRKIRVDVAADSNHDRRNDRGYRDDERGFSRSDEDSDWRSGGPSRNGPDRSPDRGGYDRYDRNRSYNDRGYGGYSDRDRNYGDRYSDRDRRDGDRRYNDRDRGYNRDRDYDRDRGYGDRDRDRGYGDRDRGYGDRDRRYGDQERRYNDRGGRSGYNDRDRGGSRGYDNYDRDRDSYGGGRYGDNRYDDNRRGDRNEGPRERQKLQLKPRSVLLDEKQKGTTDSQGSAANPAIFGDAKPVDTATKEQEIEQKLMTPQKKRTSTIIKRYFWSCQTSRHCCQRERN